MSSKTRNLLTENPTNWRIWYAIIPSIAMLTSSFISNGIAMLGGPDSILVNLSPIMQFIIMTLIVMATVRIFSGKKITASNMGYDRKAITVRNIVIIIAVFVISHLLFNILSKIVNVNSDAKTVFTNSGFGKSFFSDLTLIVAGTIFAPVFEELVYRGVMLRSVNDGMLRLFPNSKSIIGIPAIVGILITAIAFIMPHVSNMNINVMTIAYFVTSAGFSLVYLLTGSMVAAMVSHSLQSAVAYSKILIYGHGDYNLSPVIYGIAFLCPIIVFFFGKLIGNVFFNKSK